MAKTRGHAQISESQNDPAWYANYNLDGLINVNWGNRESLAQPPVVDNLTELNVPDLYLETELTVPTSVTVGIKKDVSGFWDAIQILMNKLRAASGSNITYNIFDLALYILRTREVLAHVAMTRRTILALRLADAYDSDVPAKYAAMSAGYFGSIRNQESALAQVTAEYNRFLPLISALVPLNIDLHRRTWWIYSNIFADSPTSKFSTKVMTTVQRASWNKATGPDRVVASYTKLWTATAADPHLAQTHLDSAKITMREIMADVESSRIAGDIIKAFGSTAFVELPTIKETDTLKIRYDENALTQIKNAVIPGRMQSSNAAVTSNSSTTFLVPMNIEVEAYPGSGSVGIAPNYPASDDVAKVAVQQAKMITTVKSRISPALTLEFTRLVSLWNPTRATQGQIYAMACGTEVITQAYYLYGVGSNGTTYSLVDFADGLTTDVALRAGSWSRNDWDPELCIGDSTLYDVDNWAIINIDDLLQYHSHAAMSLMATAAFLKEQSTYEFVM